MILFYTRSQKTKVFAEVLSETLGQPLHRLHSDLDNMSDFKFLIRALKMAFTGKGYPVNNIPASVPGEIFVCGPVWGGSLVGPPRYFLENTNLSGIKVNLLLTASTPVEKYRTRALEYLSNINCIPGEAYVFATGKDQPEPDVVKEHLTALLSGSAS